MLQTANSQMDGSNVPDAHLTTEEFRGFTAKHLVDIWKVYVWVAMRNKCLEKRKGSYSLQLLVDRLNGLTAHCAGEVFLYLSENNMGVIKAIRQQEKLTNILMQQVAKNVGVLKDERYNSLPLIIACVLGKEDSISSLISNRDQIWYKYWMQNMYYVGEPTSYQVDIRDHPQTFQYTPVFYAVSCDSHVGLKVLLQRGLLEKISLQDLVVSCVSLRAWECLKLLFRQFDIPESLAHKGLRFACGKRHEFIPFFRDKCSEYNENTIETFPFLLHDIFERQAINPAKCSNLMSSIMTGTPTKNHTAFFNYQALKALVRRSSYVTNWRVNASVLTAFFEDIDDSFDLMMRGNPGLLEAGKEDLVRYALTVYHGVCRNNWQDRVTQQKFIKFIRKLLDCGFNSVCNYRETGECALAFLTDIFVHEGKLIGLRQFTNTDTKAIDTFFHLLSVLVRDGCNPDFLRIESLLLNSDYLRRIAGYRSQTRIHVDINIRLHSAVTCFCLLWRQGSRFTVVKWRREDTLFQYLTSRYNHGFIAHETLAAYLHVCGVVTLHTDFSQEAHDQELFNLIDAIFSQFQTNMINRPPRHQQAYSEYLSFLVYFLDTHQRNVISGRLKINLALINADLPSNTSTIPLKCKDYVIPAYTLLTTCSTLRDACILVIRNLVLHNRGIATQSYNAQAYWIPERIRDRVVGADETCAHSLRNIPSQCPLLEVMERNLPLPKSMCNDVAGVTSLTNFLSKLWSDDNDLNC